MKEIEAFLAANPSEIVTLILEDYVETPNGLPKLFKDSGLTKYWFPVSSMPQNGQDWPLVSDMVASNQRLVVFTSIKSKQDTEGVAYQWNYMVENQYLEIYFSSDYVDGDDGMEDGKCFNRAESASLSDTTKSLVLVNYFSSIPVKQTTCEDNSGRLINMLDTCYVAANNRWANFVAVDFYKVLLLLEVTEEGHFKQQICLMGDCSVAVMMYTHAWLGLLLVHAAVLNSNDDTNSLWFYWPLCTATYRSIQ
ncbi:hypothetical protein B296_00020887, partial [Ensete ventricosum]